MSYLEGPDQIIPCENFTTTEADKCVKLRISENDDDIELKPQSIPGLLHTIAKKYSNNVALIQNSRRGGVYKTYTYEEYEMNVRFCAKAFLKLGLQRHHSVCILGFNSPEWFFAKIGAIYAGGISTGIYNTNSPEACFHILKNSRANFVVVDETSQMRKILVNQQKLPDLKAIIQYNEESLHPEIIKWEDFIEIGSNEPDDELEKVLKTIAINQPCSLIYTSGTIGEPKGVLLSHDNVIYTAKVMAQQLNIEFGKETIVSYLPLSHIIGQLIDIYIGIYTAMTIFFANRDALKGSLVKTLQVAKPTRVIGVPRVWEKIMENILEIGVQNNYIKRQIAAWAKEKGLEYNTQKLMGIDNMSWSYYIANKLVFKKVKTALGLDRVKVLYSGAAPLSTDVKKFFLSLDLIILEGYGLSEACCHCFNSLNQMCPINIETVGRPLKGFKSKLNSVQDSDEKELCVYGRHIFMGYLGDVAQTEEVFDAEGWLKTGDAAVIDNNEQIFIVGRIKELIITAGGENVAPIPIEQQIKEKMFFVSNAVLIGDRHKFLSLLLTLKTEINENTQVPTDVLKEDVQTWLKNLGSVATTVTEVLEEGPHPKVMAAIQSIIDKVNNKAISNAQKIQKFAILPKDFSTAGGEFGPTLKLKRRVILKKYKDIIEKFYETK